jgi:hypothetical protein
MITSLERFLTYPTATVHSGAFIPVDGENRHWTSTIVRYTAMCLASYQKQTTRRCVNFDLSIHVIYVNALADGRAGR